MRPCVIGLVLAHAALARAPEVDPIEIHWDAPPGCPAADRVHEHALRRAAAEASQPVVARGTVRSIDASTWLLELSIQGPAGTEHREIRASSCEALAEAAGLLIAVAADPSAAPDDVEVPEVATPPEVVTTPEVVTMPPIADTPRETPAPVIPPPRPSPKRRRITAAARIEIGGQFLRVLPASAGLAFGGALALRLPSSRVELRGRYALGHDAHQADRPDISASIDLWTVGASGCYAPRWRRLEFPICVGAELGRMRAVSSGVTDPGSAGALFAALPIDANLVWAPIPRVGLVAGAGVSPTLRRPSFHVRGLDPLFVAAPVGLRLVAGVEVRFP